jgi:hypothetical protein
MHEQAHADDIEEGDVSGSTYIILCLLGEILSVL